MFLLWLVLACVRPARHPLVVPPDVVVEVGTPPFTAVEIHDAMPVGTMVRMRVEEAGQAPVEKRWVVTKSTDTECTIHETIWDGATLKEDRGETTTRWSALRDHADFRGRNVVESDETISGLDGLATARVYTVTDPDGTVSSYAFRVDLPGPPVRLIVTRDGETLLHMTQFERRSVRSEEETEMLDAIRKLEERR